MPTTDEEIMRQLMATFKLEADEHLQAMNELLLKLEKNQDASQTQPLIEDIFREAHSLKGAARAVDAALVESVAHGIENVFAAAKRGEIEPTPGLYDLFYEALDRITVALTSLSEGGEAIGDSDDLLKRLEEAGTGALRAAAPKTARPKAERIPKNIDVDDVREILGEKIVDSKT